MDNEEEKDSIEEEKDSIEFQVILLLLVLLVCIGLLGTVLTAFSN